MSDLSPGSKLETVLLGSLCGDVLRVWRASGEAECRQVQRVEAVANVLGGGVLARTSSEPNRFREVGLLDAMTGVLLLAGRGCLQQGSHEVTTGAVTVNTRVGPAPKPSHVLWTTWGEWVGRVAVAAAGRGEYVVVETGSWDAIAEPYVLMGVFPGAEGSWVSHVEAKPTPVCEPWNTVGDGKQGTPVSAPANLTTVGVAGLLAIQAIGMWAPTPLDVVLTFGSSPAGPWSPDVAARA